MSKPKLDTIGWSTTRCIAPLRKQGGSATGLGGAHPAHWLLACPIPAQCTAMRTAGAVGWGVSEPGGWEPRAPHTRRAHDPPVSVAGAPNLLPTPGPPAPLSWFPPLRAPAMPKNGVTGVQSPGSGGWAGRVDSTHRLSPAEAGSQRRRWAISRGLQVRAKFVKGGRKRTHTGRARASEGGHVRRARGFPRRVSRHFRASAKSVGKPLF